MKQNYFDRAPSRLGILARFLLVPLGALGLIGGVGYGITTAQMSHANGIYGSYRYGDAKYAVEQVLSYQYGLDTASKMRLLTPPMVKTHVNNIKQPVTKTDALMNWDTGQVRVFHLQGPRGVKWCVGVWDNGFGPKDQPYGKYFVTRSCQFKLNGGA